MWIGGNGRTANAPPTAESAGNAAPTGAAATKAKQAAKAKAAPGGPPHYHDSMVLKFTQDGKFLMAIGKPGASEGSNDVENLGLPAKIFVDPKTNELYIADGYGNKRVIVFDADTGKYKRHWGAYGNKPDDTNLGPYNPDAPPAQQFRNPVHCAELSLDGLLYVCDRVNDRIQVFKPDGTFVKEAFIAKNTLGDGSAWDIAFSKDPQQKYIYLADGANEKIYIMLRDTLEILTSFGDGGRQPGQFYAVHSIATDSKGQHLHHRNLPRPARAEVRLQGPRGGHQEGPGRRLAEEVAGPQTLIYPGFSADSTFGMNDRRFDLRVPVVDTVMLSWTDQTGQKHDGPADLADISALGSFGTVAASLEVGAAVSLVYQDQEFIGRVRNCELGASGYVLGIEFEDGYRWSPRKRR